jgi:23S rRNA pseudouridine2605 synthase
MQELKNGVRLSDGNAKFELLEDQGGDGRNRWYRAVVKEGRNRVVRRMFEALGLQVSRLMRVRFGIVSLPPRLKRGNWIELKEAEISELLEWSGSVPEPDEEDVSDANPPPSAERQNRHRPRSRAR